MSVAPRSWRPAPLLPARDAVGLALGAGGLVICLLASLALTWLGADLGAGRALATRLGGAVTVAVAPSRGSAPLESATAAAWRAAEILSTVPGVASAKVMRAAPGDGALARMIGADAAAHDPGRLIALEAAPGRGLPAPAILMQRLRVEGVAAGLDDHGLWSGPVERDLFVSALRLIGFCLVSLVALGALGAWGADRLTVRHANRIGLLGGFGMTDRDLLWRLLAPLFIIAALDGVLGAVGGGLLAGAGGLRPPGLAAVVAAPRGLDLFTVLLWPPLAFLATGGAAALMARRDIRRLVP